MTAKKLRFWIHRNLRKFWKAIHFHKTIHFRTLKGYLDFEQGRWPVILFNLGLFCPELFSPISLSVELTKPEDFDQTEIERSHSKNLDLICQEVKPNLGRMVRRKFGKPSKVYILEGLELTQEDYYFILKDENGDRCYETCCSGLDFV